MKYLTIVIYLLCCYQLTSAQNSDTKPTTREAPPTVAHLEIGVDPVPLIDLKDVASYSGKYVKIINVVSAHRVLDTLEVLAMGGVYPNQALTIILRGKALNAFKANDIDGKTIWIYGVVWDNKENKDPQMFIDDVNMISIVRKR